MSNTNDTAAQRFLNAASEVLHEAVLQARGDDPQGVADQRAVKAGANVPATVGGAGAAWAACHRAQRQHARHGADGAAAGRTHDADRPAVVPAPGQAPRLRAAGRERRLRQGRQPHRGVPRRLPIFAEARAMPDNERALHVRGCVAHLSRPTGCGRPAGEEGQQAGTHRGRQATADARRSTGRQRTA
ncbi:MAG: hypothetical protein MZW92_24600 [Comamonadaceae bacterium]|nr:hypothetical protein [Comamonadaceae bacterium]